MEENSSKKESGGGCLSTIIFVVIVFFVIRSCSGASDEKKEPDVTEPVQSTISNEEDGTVDIPETTKIYDEVVSVVDFYIKAELDRDIETALVYCTDSLKDEVCNSVEKINAEISASTSGYMDTFVSAAQSLFDSYGDYSDTINAEYLYDDSEMKELCAELTESIYRNSRIYSLPEKAEMLSDMEAVVAVDFKAKNFTEAENSLFDYVKSYLENIAIEKLRENSNFIKKLIVKKVVKEVVIDCAKDFKSRYEQTKDEISIGKKTYYLTKDDGKWLIKKIDVDNSSNQHFGEESVEEDYYEDEYGEETNEGINDGLEEGYYEDEITTQYILPYSSDEYLLESDVENLSEEECRIARNEIYARHGRKFDDEQLQNYFDACSWYEGTINPEDFSEDILNEVEKANLQMIAEYEEEMGY